MLSIFYFCLIIFTSFKHCLARDTITINNLLRDGEEHTLISAGEIFELGFFTPNESSFGYRKRYVGIWYYNLTPKTVVWVANRDNPVQDSSGTFVISQNGNLMILDSTRKSYWSTNLETSPSSSLHRKVKLLDNGNLIVFDEEQEQEQGQGQGKVKILWQSFDNPTDTFLPGMKMDESLSLTSWRSNEEPASGNFTFEQDEKENQYIIWKRSIRYWKSSVSGKFVGTGEMSSAISYLLSNFTLKISPNNTVPFLTSSLYSNTRLVMTYWGQLKYLKMDSEKK
ncbi:G-type lectin S-receptor serine/threonine-protein kinase [Trifolium repens]|nr:G-type lectin S-receptor serine/threonine-protein kinase [Trifolium repens]